MSSHSGEKELRERGFPFMVQPGGYICPRWLMFNPKRQRRFDRLRAQPTTVVQRDTETAVDMLLHNLQRAVPSIGSYSDRVFAVHNLATEAGSMRLPTTPSWNPLRSPTKKQTKRPMKKSMRKRLTPRPQEKETAPTSTSTLILS